MKLSHIRTGKDHSFIKPGLGRLETHDLQASSDANSYDMTLCAIRIPVVGGKSENESMLVPVVLVANVRHKEAAVAVIPFANLTDFKRMDDAPKAADTVVAHARQAGSGGAHGRT